VRKEKQQRRWAQDVEIWKKEEEGQGLKKQKARGRTIARRLENQRTRERMALTNANKQKPDRRKRKTLLT